MVVGSTLSTFAGLPDELVAALAAEAEAAATMVGQFLEERAPALKRDWRVGLPPRFLLDLGAALLIREWEVLGFSARLDRGLPSSETALLGAIGLLLGRPPTDQNLMVRVVRVFADHFAWHARVDLRAPVLLDSREDDDTLLKLAQFLFDHRYVSGRQPTEPADR
jgi:hypothetical protein